MPAPAELPAPLGEGGSLVHLDLHPGNVVLTASGPMVIDWPNAARGDPLADVAYTWVILTTSRLEGSWLHRLMLATGRRLFAAALLAGFDRRAVFRQLPVVVRARLADRYVLDEERVRLRRLMAVAVPTTMAWAGGSSYSPTTSPTRASSSGSVEHLKVSVCKGSTSCSAQTLATVLWRPTTAACSVKPPVGLGSSVQPTKVIGLRGIQGCQSPKMGTAGYWPSAFGRPG